MGKQRDLTPLDLDDEDLDELARITDADIVRTADAWRRIVTGKYKTMLDADAVIELEDDADGSD